MNLREGTILQDGKYHIVRFIKGGGFGCTYEAEHTLLEKRVAVKEFFVKDFCNRDEATGHVSVGTQGNQALVAKLKRKFIEEAKVLSRLHHKGIVSVTDVFEENGTAYYVMDYIEGCSLHATLEHEGKLSEERALGYIRQVAEALAYVHAQHRLHLDVKPGNIMVDSQGNATLIDFGTSKQYDEENGENTSTVQGYTKGFAPPEQMTNDVVKFMPSTDIYALGATLYKLITGITPPSATLRISGEGLAALPASVSAATEQAIEQAMRLNKALRPQTIDAFLALLGTPSTVADDEETDLDIDDDKDDDVNHRGDEHKGKSGLSLRMKKLLWPIVICVAVVLGFLGVKLYNDYCAKRDMTKYSVVTTPSGATVFIDGKKMGVTPIEDKEIARGSYKIKLSKDGYEDKEFTSTFGDNPVMLSETLTEKPKPQTQSSPTQQQQQQPAKPQQPVKEESVVSTTTEFYVTTTPSGATVHVDGKKVGTTPIEGKEIAHGSHKVRISKDGYKDTTFMRTFGNKAVMLNVMLTDKPKSQSQTQQVQQTVISSSSSPNLSDARGKNNGHEYVDLGLSVMWATCNVGASYPGENGDYFAWGEIEKKTKYKGNNCKTFKKSFIGDITADPSYDVARTNWGGTWRLPTKEEIEELKDNCIWEWISQDEIVGCYITGPNGQRIFLPAAGWYEGTSFKGSFSGHYWCATPYLNSEKSYELHFTKGKPKPFVFWNYRFLGYSVRPVFDKKNNDGEKHERTTIKKRNALEQIKQLAGDEVKKNAPKFGF